MAEEKRKVSVTEQRPRPVLYTQHPPPAPKDAQEFIFLSQSSSLKHMQLTGRFQIQLECLKWPLNPMTSQMDVNNRMGWRIIH